MGPMGPDKCTTYSTLCVFLDLCGTDMDRLLFGYEVCIVSF